eukprot:scaffold150249_cov15-Tisochrysis_lutea.AAC.1
MLEADNAPLIRVDVPKIVSSMCNQQQRNIDNQISLQDPLAGQIQKFSQMFERNISTKGAISYRLSHPWHGSKTRHGNPMCDIWEKEDTPAPPKGAMCIQEGLPNKQASKGLVKHGKTHFVISGGGPVEVAKGACMWGAMVGFGGSACDLEGVRGAAYGSVEQRWPRELQLCKFGMKLYLAVVTHV